MPIKIGRDNFPSFFHFQKLSQDAPFCTTSIFNRNLQVYNWAFSIRQTKLDLIVLSSQPGKLTLTPAPVHCFRSRNTSNFALWLRIPLWSSNAFRLRAFVTFISSCWDRTFAHWIWLAPHKWYQIMPIQVNFWGFILLEILSGRDSCWTNIWIDKYFASCCIENGFPIFAWYAKMK